MNNAIEEKLKKLPEKPGVYIMKDKDGEVIYVGKAIILKNRVRQYFQSSKNQLPKVAAMVSNIADFEYIITSSELEALVLECNLIKEHRPYYNICLKDDKHYPYIKITLNETYPRIILTRQLLKDNCKYYGPFTDTLAVRKTIDLMSGIFAIRTCGKTLAYGKNIDRPCLNAQISRCIAPCQGNILPEVYAKKIKEVISCLDGKTDELLKDLGEKMLMAADTTDFEHAALIRDQINAIKKISEKQKVLSTNQEEQDIIGFAQKDSDTCVQIFFIREGKLIGREHFFLEGLNYKQQEEKEILTAFVKQYYTDASAVPKEIILQNDIDEIDTIHEWLSDKKGSRVHIIIPQKGDKMKLVSMVKENAMDTLNLYIEKNKKDFEKTIGACMELKVELKLNKDIHRMEAFDISNISGVDSVGSMIVFHNGKPSSKEYRRFKIKTVEGANDYESMREIFKRRVEHGIREKKEYEEQNRSLENSKFAQFPDVFMIDGGLGHVNAVLPILAEYGLDIPVCGMVKDDKHRTRGLIYEGKEIIMPINSNVFRMINAMQDEAHRFAISYHRSLRAKAQIRSALDEIEGIGEAKKKALLKQLGSVDKIKRATVEELETVIGINNKLAINIYEYFNRRK